MTPANLRAAANSCVEMLEALLGACESLSREECDLGGASEPLRIPLVLTVRR